MIRQLFHGSPSIIEKPQFGYGKVYNDYGLGFYCTDSLEMAKELLTDETQKVKDVGAMVGYENSAHFVSIFRKKFGMTPNEYRRIILEGKNMVQKRNGKNT